MPTNEDTQKYAIYNEQIDTQAAQHVVQMEADYARRLEVLEPVVVFARFLKQEHKLARLSYPGTIHNLPMLTLEPVAKGSTILVSVRLVMATWLITISCDIDRDSKIEQTFAEMDGYGAVYTAISKLVARIMAERRFENAQSQKLAAEREGHSQSQGVTRAKA